MITKQICEPCLTHDDWSPWPINFSGFSSVPTDTSSETRLVETIFGGASSCIYNFRSRMAPAVAATSAATTAATAATAATTSTVASLVIGLPFNSTTTQVPDYIWNDDPPTPSYVYFYSGYAFYIVLLFVFVLLMPFVVIMSSMQRKRQENARRLVLQRQRARREMEISVSNNGTNIGSTCGDGNVCVQADNDMTILPKGMDLPPSYDELNICSSGKQEGNIGASTLTITTDLGCSNPNLAAALNEPPPDYQGTIDNVPAQTTTISTTTTIVSVTPRM